MSAPLPTIDETIKQQRERTDKLLEEYHASHPHLKYLQHPYPPMSFEINKMTGKVVAFYSGDRKFICYEDVIKQRKAERRRRQRANKAKKKAEQSFDLNINSTQ